MWFWLVIPSTTSPRFPAPIPIVSWYYHITLIRCALRKATVDELTICRAWTFIYSWIFISCSQPAVLYMKITWKIPGLTLCLFRSVLLFNAIRYMWNEGKPFNYGELSISPLERWPWAPLGLWPREKPTLCDIVKWTLLSWVLAICRSHKWAWQLLLEAEVL